MVGRLPHDLLIVGVAGDDLVVGQVVLHDPGDGCLMVRPLASISSMVLPGERSRSSAARREISTPVLRNGQSFPGMDIRQVDKAIQGLGVGDGHHMGALPAPLPLS